MMPVSALMAVLWLCGPQSCICICTVHRCRVSGSIPRKYDRDWSIIYCESSDDINGNDVVASLNFVPGAKQLI